MTPGKARIRVVHDSYSMPSLAVDVGDDGSSEIEMLPRFAASDDAGIEVAAGADLALSVKPAVGGTAPLAAFVVPATALADGAQLYFVLSGLTTFRARDPRAARLVVIAAGGASVSVLLNPTIYVLGASPDQPALDAFLDDTKAVDNLTFGTLKPARLRPTASGHTLALHAHSASGAPPDTAPIASLSTGPLAAGQQCLVVLGGLVTDTSLALHAYNDQLQLALDGFGKLRAINATLDVPQIDVGWFDVANHAWHDVPDFANLTAGAGSPPAGTSIADGNIAVPIHPGVRVAGDATTEVRFASPALGNTDRWLGVAAGARTPVTGQLGLRFLLVKTAASTWTATTLTPQTSVRAARGTRHH